MTAEKSLWTWLKQAKVRMSLLDLQRIENGVGVGTPDVEGCYKGKAFWIELKAEERPVRLTTSVVKFGEGSIRNDQIAWLEYRWRCGGRAFVLFQVGSGYKAKRYLVRGCDAHRLPGLTEPELAAVAVRSPVADPVSVIDAVTQLYVTEPSAKG